MNNADMPAMPVNELHQGDGSLWFQHMGLSKRELFAMAAMQGLMSRTDMGSEERAQYAVENANELLAALSKEPQA